MSPAVSVAKAKPAVWVVDAGDIGTAIGVVPVFLWPPELGKPLSYTHYELHMRMHSFFLTWIISPCREIFVLYFELRVYIDLPSNSEFIIKCF